MIVTPTPRPWRVLEMTRHAGGVWFFRIVGPNGEHIANLYPHESVGGRGIDQARADAELLVALANSPAAAEFEGSDRHATEVEIPEAERAPAPPTARLL